MNCFLSFRLLAAAAAFAGSVHAQSIMVTPGELIIPGKFTSAGSESLVLVDRASGQVRLADQSAGGLVWSGPVPGGISDVSEAATGSLGLGSSLQNVVLSSASTQRLVRLTPSALANPPFSIESAAPEPGGVVGLSINDPVTELTDKLWLGAGAAVAANAGTLGIASVGAVLFPDPAAATVLRLHSGRRSRLTSGGPYRAVFIGSDGVSSSVRVFGSSTSFGTSISARATITGFRPDAHFSLGPMDATGNAILIVASPTSATVSWMAMPVPGGAQTFPAPATTFSAGGNVISTCPVNQSNARGVVLLLTDGTAQFFRFTGTGFVLKQTFTPDAGSLFSGVLAGLAESKLSLLTRPAAGGASTGWKRFTVQLDGTYATESQGVIPPVKIPAMAHAFFFTAEPFADPAAAFLSSARVPDWTSGTRALPVATVQREIFGTAASGLGSSAAANLGAAPGLATWVLANQYAGDTSVFALSSEPLSGAEPSASISPLPGAYPAEPGESIPDMRLSFTANPANAAVYYRFGSGAFLRYTTASVLPDTSTGPTLLSFGNAPASRTVQYYAQSGNLRSRLQTAAFSFGPQPSVNPGASTDADANGLADEWERYYGLTDPNGDPDSDGLTNLTEQNAGTDPLHNCGETAAALALTLEALPGGGQIRLTLSRGLLPAEILQRSPDLQTWTPVTLPTGSTQSTQPVTTSRMYYRVSR